MKKAVLLSILVVVVQLSVAVIAEAQQPKKVPLIGYVDAGSPASTGHRAQAFVQGLKALGYVEGQNVTIEYRWAEGKN
jgi:putative tryptophan/tyrosine transport system substrate-binding protein